MLGTWIDALSAEQKDRVIEGQGWTEKMIESRTSDDRCLVGHAVGGLHGWRHVRARDRCDLLLVGCRFDRLVARYGLTRIVALCKARAAKSNRIALSEPARVTT